MSALARVQREFQDYLLRGDMAVESRVLGTARVPVATRLGIYAGAYRSRLTEQLSERRVVALERLGEAAAIGTGVDSEARGDRHARGSEHT